MKYRILNVIIRWKKYISQYLRDSNYNKKKKYFYKFISYSVERNMETRSEDYTYKDDITTVLMIIYIAKLFIC